MSVWVSRPIPLSQYYPAITTSSDLDFYSNQLSVLEIFLMSRYRWTKNVEKFKGVPKKIIGIGNLDVLPEEVLNDTLTFIPLWELTTIIISINKRFRKLVWKSLKDRNCYSEEIIIKKSDIEYLKKNGNKSRYKILPDFTKDYRLSCSFGMFKKLLNAKAVKLDECSNILIEHLIRKSENTRNYEYVEGNRRTFISEYNRSKSLVRRMRRNIDLIESILDHSTIRVEKEDMSIKDSYFHSAVSLGNSRLVDLYLKNPGKFRIPNKEETIEYCTNFEIVPRKEVINTIFEHSPMLDITQEIFEKYVSFVRSGCHSVDFLEPFLDHYIPIFTNNRRLFSTEKFPRRVYLSLRIIYELIDMKRKCHHKGDVIHQLVRFINHFGVTKERKKGVFIKKKRIGWDREQRILSVLMKNLKEADEADYRNNMSRNNERIVYFSPREEEAVGRGDGAPIISTVVSNHSQKRIYNDEFDEVQKLDSKRKWRRNRVGMVIGKQRSKSGKNKKKKQPSNRSILVKLIK